MLDFFHTPASSLADIQRFTANSLASPFSWTAWNKPRGVSTVCIIAIGAGGNGGNGAVGAASTAAGGGGGGSGGISIVTVPAIFIPDVLYCSVGYGGAGVATRVAIIPTGVSNDLIAIANFGGNGGNASGATAGSVGAAAAAAAINNMPIAGLGLYNLLAGQAGIIGATVTNGGALTIPTSGIFVTGGTGGAGVGNAASTGFTGGSFTVAGAFPVHVGGAAAGSQTTPARNGSNGFDGVCTGLFYSYGGTGGGSSGGAATGAGLYGGKGGAGGIGCGGGGGGGAFTGSTQGTGGRGGDGLVMIISY